MSVRADSRPLAQALSRVYAHHPTLAGGFADFHVELRRANGVRRWVKPQVDFLFDGQRPFKPLPAGQALAMLEWGMNWCVASHCHQYLVLHAASLEKNGHAIVLPAPPGSGKSTLCAALMLSGWRLLSDELTLIDPHSGALIGLVRPINLKNQSIDLIGSRFAHAVFGPVMDDTQKGRVAHLAPSADSVTHMAQPARARWVILPRYRAGHGLSVQPMSARDSFLALAENSFNYSTLGRAGFHAVGTLTTHTRSILLTYSQLDDALAVINPLPEAQ